MAIYDEAAGLNLLSGATDPNGDGLTVARINGQLVTTWPVTVPLAKGALVIQQNGLARYDDTGLTSIGPNVRQDAGTITFTLTDGIAESAVETATISILGVNLPPVGQNVTLNFNVRAR